MTFVLNINCDNAAFEPDPEQEVAGILDKIAYLLIREGPHTADCWHTIFDSNGNDVGRWRLK